MSKSCHTLFIFFLFSQSPVKTNLIPSKAWALWGNLCDAALSVKAPEGFATAPLRAVSVPPISHGILFDASADFTDIFQKTIKWLGGTTTDRWNFVWFFRNWTIFKLSMNRLRQKAFFCIPRNQNNTKKLSQLPYQYNERWEWIPLAVLVVYTSLRWPYTGQ